MPLHVLHEVLNDKLSKVFRKYPFQHRYAFTVSPHQRHAGLGTMVAAVRDLFILYKGTIFVSYIEEVSDMGKHHIHGVVVMRSKCKFVKMRKHPVCQYYFRPYDDTAAWANYMGKKSPSHLFSIYSNVFYSYKPHIEYLKLDWFGFH